MRGVSKRVLALITIFLFKLVCDCRSDCLLSLDKDFGNPSPVFIRNGVYLAPNLVDGGISFSRSDTVIVACPGSKRKIILGNESTSYDVLEAHCIINSTFRVDRQIVQFKDIKCNSQPFFTNEETAEYCHGHNKMYNVGYQIKSNFYTLYEACFDKYLLHTHYVIHHLTPMSVYIQKLQRRPQFTEGGLYGKVKMNEIYKQDNQKSRLDAILGYPMSSQYLSKNQFLTRGHLAARADYTTSAEMRATFQYINTAPQWMRGNAGDWAALEEALRRRVQARGYNVTVFTGTHGVMMLPNKAGRMTEVYLHADDNNNPVVPVPMYFYKLVYDPIAKSAAAFISINSSFYNDTIIESLAFCEDICDQNPKFNWLTWRSNDGTFSFCCDYDQFVEVVDYLPQLEVNTRFY